MAKQSTVDGYAKLQRYRKLKDVPRPSVGRSAMFIHVLDSGEEVLTCMLDDGRTVPVMDAENTKAQLEAIEHKR